MDRQDYLKSERIGKTAQEITLLTNQAARERLMKALVDTREINNYEAEYRFKDGSMHHGLTSARVTGYP